jgi:hypothetical protein
MMLFGLAIVFGIVMIANVINYKHSKSNTEYSEYLLQLEEVKQRKRERNET